MRINHLSPLIIALFIAMPFTTVKSQSNNLFDWIGHGASPLLMFGEGVTTDEDGNAYVSGFFQDRYAYAGDTISVSPENNSMFFSKISPQNEVIWTVTAEASGIQGVNGFKSVYKNDKIYLFGDFRGVATFGSMDFTEVVLQSQFRAFFIAKYNLNGVLEWVKPVTSDNSVGLVSVGGTHSMVIDEEGSVYVATGFRNSINIAGNLVPDPTPFENRSNAIVFKLDKNGAYQWHWNSQHGGTDNAMAINMNDQEELYFTVRYADTLQIEDNITAHPDEGGFALIQMDKDGNHVWDRVMFTESNAVTGFRAFAMEFDDAGNLYLAGSYRTLLFIGPGQLLQPVNTVRSDGFIIQFDAENKDWVWAKNYGNPDENDDIKSLVYQGNHRFLMAGNFEGQMVLSDEITLTSNENSTDPFYATVDDLGNVIHAESFGGTSDENLSQLATSPGKDSYLVGRFQNIFAYQDTTFISWGSFDYFLLKLRQPSDNALLSAVSFDENILENFDPNTFQYEISLPFDTETVPQISVTPQSAFAQISIVQAQSLTGTEQERTATVTVTSETEVNTSEYIFTFRLMNNDASLANLQLDGSTPEDFDPATLDYEYILNWDEEFPEITATPNDPLAMVEISESDSPPNDLFTYFSVHVTAEDPSYTLTYTLGFRNEDNNSALKSITVDGEVINGFSPDVFNYTVLADASEENFVEVTPQSEFASLDIQQITDLQGSTPERTATITVDAEADGFQSVYSVVFQLVNTWVDQENPIEATLFPNPVSGILHITTDIPNYKVQIYNAAGQIISTSEKTHSSTSTIDLSDLPDGIYQVLISNENHKAGFQIIKE